MGAKIFSLQFAKRHSNIDPNFGGSCNSCMVGPDNYLFQWSNLSNSGFFIYMQGFFHNLF